MWIGKGLELGKLFIRNLKIIETYDEILISS